MPKPLLKFVVCIWLALSMNQTGVAQTVRSYMSPMGSLADTAKGNFSSLEGGYSIALPSRNTGRRDKTYSWRLAEGFFAIGHQEAMQESIEKPSEGKLIELAREAMNGVFRDVLERMPEGELSHKPITFSGYPGVAVRLEMSNGLAFARTIWVDKRAYLIAVLLVGEQRRHENAALQVVDSLKINSKAEIEAALQQLFKDAQPAPLPQAPATQKLKSDAEDEGLKGKVKVVVEEWQEATGGNQDSTRRRSIEISYNEAGQRLQDISYNNDGNPSTITVYGYIDRARVTRIGSVEYGNSIPGIALPQGKSKPDERYDFRHVYHYDQKGNLGEYLFYNNAGILLDRFVYQRRANQIIEVRYDKGRIVERFISRIDEKGNTTERKRVSVPPDREPDNYIYENYEFDSQGNWVKRSVSVVTEFGGRRFAGKSFLEYRSILYY